jgi:hypothetical protein
MKEDSDTGFVTHVKSEAKGGASTRAGTFCCFPSPHHGQRTRRIMLAH